MEANEYLEESDLYEPVKNAMVKAVEDIEKNYHLADLSPDKYVITGIKNLNFHKGDLIILGDDSSANKSTFSLNLLKKLSLEQKLPVGYISGGYLDYGKLGQKLISMESGIPFKKINKGILEIEDVREIQESAARIFDSPFYYYDKPNIRFSELELVVQKMIEEQKVELVVIDSFEYLQEVVDAKEGEYRQVLEAQLNNFKNMADNFNIPVILLMDMPAFENESKPSLSDFKKYMVIPRTSDKLMYLHTGSENNKACVLTFIK